jgi:hypothetical protein
MIEVTISERAQHVIHEELDRARRDIEHGVETGGWLWTERGVPWWGGLKVVEASGPGPDDVRGWNTMALRHRPRYAPLPWTLARRQHPSMAQTTPAHPRPGRRPLLVRTTSHRGPPSHLRYHAERPGCRAPSRLPSTQSTRRVTFSCRIRSQRQGVPLTAARTSGHPALSHFSPRTIARVPDRGRPRDVANGRTPPHGARSMRRVAHARRAQRRLHRSLAGSQAGPQS